MKGLEITAGSSFIFANAIGKSPPTRLAHITRMNIDSPTIMGIPNRSEERRVGKECRSRCSPYH